MFDPPKKNALLIGLFLFIPFTCVVGGVTEDVRVVLCYWVWG